MTAQPPVHRRTSWRRRNALLQNLQLRHGERCIAWSYHTRQVEVINADIDRLRALTGIAFRPLDESLRDGVESPLAVGQVPVRRRAG